MNDKMKSRPKEQTIHQLSSRSNRNFMSARMRGMVETNNTNFSAQELVNLEMALREDMHTNPWLVYLSKAITDESVSLTKDELDM